MRQYPVLIIIIAELFGTSLWFSPNSASADLMRTWSLSVEQFAHLTSAVQLGFIVGTLLLSVSGFADRFSASKVFATACTVGAGLNAIFALVPLTFDQALLIRCAVGISLAGIYPLGMKMVVAWTRGGAGSALGLLVAMLTLGTALPYAIRFAGADLSWQAVILTSSILALMGAFLVFFLGEGPHLSQRNRTSPRLGAALVAFKDRSFRAAAFGYFGHMWELYAFWTIVPFLVSNAVQNTNVEVAARPRLISFLGFIIIGVGALGCILAGRLSRRFGSPKVAAVALGTSGSMCLLYPFVSNSSFPICIAVLLFWGMSVIADSAQFSAIAATTCPPDVVGSALSIQNCIGFLLTILSISLITINSKSVGPKVVWLLLPGPILGLLFLLPLLGRKSSS